MANEITDLTRRFRLQLNLGSDAVPDWQTVIGMVEFKPSVEPTIKDDTDYETEGWKGNTKTLQEWKIEAKISHKYDPNTELYHPTHEALEAASEAFGAASLVGLRYFDRFGKASGRQGKALVTWEPEGGEAENLDQVKVTLTGDGPLNVITNPLNATPLPIVASLAPATGPAAGGTLVIVSGANFTGASAVAFGATSAPNFQVISPTKIAVISPAAAASVRDVRVTTPNGQSANTAADDYTYV